MDNISRWPANDRADLFQEASAQLGISPAVIEKDFWVCWLLKMLFADKILGGKILLKGGTSLSKAFSLIKRFSEDIDLVLNWNEVVEEDPYQERSKTKQDRFNKAVCSRTREYLKAALPS
jgi:predicted nucleotidyltransferase component of viral defense system